MEQQWTGRYWHNKTLKDLGLIVQLGHPGTPCRNPDNVFNMTVLDSHGIHQVSACFCKCERALHASKRAQLLRARWYPATVTDPTTCATFRVLEEFHLQNLKGALNVHNWIGALAMRTDGTRVALTPVSCNGLRYVTALLMVSRSARKQCRGFSGSGHSSNVLNAQGAVTTLPV